LAENKLSWEEVYKLCVTLADNILRDNQRPRVIVTPDKDSWPFGRILCDLLGVKTLLHLGNVEDVEKTLKLKQLKPDEILLSVTRAESLGKAEIQAKISVFPGLKVAALVASSTETGWRPDYVGKTFHAHPTMPWENQT